MSFIEKLNQKYEVVAASSLAKQIERLAADVIALGYDPKTETSLLGTLKKAYDAVKGEEATADTNWDRLIKENKAKKEKRAQQIKEENRKVLIREDKGGPSARKQTADELPAKKKRISDNIHRFGNVVSVDFSKKDSVPKLDPDDPKRGNTTEYINDRNERIRESLKKINTLMEELKDKSGA